MRVRIELNGAAYDVADGSTVADLIEAATGSVHGSAVVVEDQVIPRSSWREVRLRADQRVELITAVQGG